MTIQQCIYALKIAECGSLNKAAGQLFIAQSSLSSSIKQLEEELQSRLFERSNHGVILTQDGSQFIRCAAQLVRQHRLILDCLVKGKGKKRLHIATQHYDFIADLFVKFIRNYDFEEYEYSLREMKTYDIIHEIKNGASDIGIIVVKNSNRELMERYLINFDIQFHVFLQVHPHVFINKAHPLAKKQKIGLMDLQNYPYISYEQGEHNSFLFCEELVDDFSCKKHIEISDRATLMNVLINSSGFTIGTGIMPSARNNQAIISVPMDNREIYEIGYIVRNNTIPCELSAAFIEYLKRWKT